MDDLTIEPSVADRRDDPRPRVGEDAARPCSVSADAAALGLGVDPLPAMKPGSVGVRYRLKRRFRTYDAFACVPTYLAQTRASDTLIGADDARLYNARSYLPLLVGGEPVQASDENLGALIRATIPAEVVHADHPAAAERELLRAMRPALDRYLLIDDEVWVRESSTR